MSMLLLLAPVRARCCLSGVALLLLLAPVRARCYHGVCACTRWAQRSPGAGCDAWDGSGRTGGVAVELRRACQSG